MYIFVMYIFHFELKKRMKNGCVLFCPFFNIVSMFIVFIFRTYLKFYSKLQQQTQQPAARLQTVWCPFLETPLCSRLVS